MSTKKHILFLSSWFPNKIEPLLGNFIYNHAKSVSTLYTISSLNVVSVAQNKEYIIDFQYTDKINTVTVYYQKINNNDAFSKIKKLYRRLKSYQIGWKAIEDKNGKIDLTHLNVIYPAGIYLFFRTLFSTTPFIVTEHWSGFLKKDGTYLKSGKFHQFITRWCFKNALYVLPVSNTLKKSFKRHHFLSRKTKVIPNVIACNIFKPDESKNKDPENIKFLHVSNLHPTKNTEAIIEAIKRITLTRKNIQLTIICDENKLEFEKIATDKGVLNKYVFFKGASSPQEIALQMQASTALINFSNFETFGITLLESYACGTPVITTKVGIATEMEQQNGIIIVENNSIESLINGMMKFVNENVHINPQEMYAYVKNNYDGKIVGEQISSIYKKVLSLN